MKNKRIRQLLVIFIIAGGAIIYNSCQKSDIDFTRISDEVELTPRIVGPVIYGDLSLDDVIRRIGSDYVDTYDDSLIYISISDTLFNGSVSDIIEPIPDQDFVEIYIESDIVGPVWVATPVGDTATFHKVKDGEWTFDNNERIDSIHLKKLNLLIDVSSTFKHEGILHIYCDEIIIDGEPFTHTVQISDVSGNFVYDTIINLDNHSIYLNNDTPGITYLPLYFDLDLINSGNPVLPGEECNVSLIFQDADFYAAFGYIGDYDRSLENGQVFFDIFNNQNFSGEFYVEDPRFTINISNSFGVPVAIDLLPFSAYSAINDVTTDFVLDGNPFTIMAPGIDSVGYFKNTVITINKDNSNIADIISSLPSEFNYSVGAVTNPAGLVSDNFVTDSSTLIVDFMAEVPLYFRASGFTLEDTTEFDFMAEIGDDIDIVEYLSLGLDVINEIPMDVDIQLFFTDANYNYLDSMFVDDAFIISPTLNAQDEVDNPEVYTKSVEFDTDKFEKIKPTKFIIIRANIMTAEATLGKPVKFYSYYDISFKLKLTADLRINSRDL